MVHQNGSPTKCQIGNILENWRTSPTEGTLNTTPGTIRYIPTIVRRHRDPALRHPRPQSDSQNGVRSVFRRRGTGIWNRPPPQRPHRGPCNHPSPVRVKERRRVCPGPISASAPQSLRERTLRERGMSDDDDRDKDGETTAAQSG